MIHIICYNFVTAGHACTQTKEALSLKKKWTLALALLLMLALPLAAQANVDYRYVKTQSGSKLRLRSTPSTSDDNKIASIPYGAEVLVEDYVNNNTWAYISYDGQTGYVATRYLSKTQPKLATNSTTEVAEGTTQEDVDVSYKGFERTNYEVMVRANVPGGYVNLRWGPSRQMPIYERVYDGAGLTVIAQNKHWAQVMDTSTGAVGFMMRSFLNEL